MVGDVAEVEEDGAAEEHGESHEAHAGEVAAGEVFGEAHVVGAEKAAEDSDGVERGDSRGGGSALEEAAGNGP